MLRLPQHKIVCDQLGGLQNDYCFILVKVFAN